MISARFPAGWGEIDPRTVHVRRGGSTYELMLWAVLSLFPETDEFSSLSVMAA
jgi:hypothetical protein